MANKIFNSPTRTVSDNFFWETSLVPRWSFDVSFEMNNSNVNVTYAAGTLLSGQLQVTKELKDVVIPTLRPWHVNSITLPPSFNGTAVVAKFGTAMAAQPAITIEPEILKLSITFVEDAGGTISKFLTILKHHVIDVTTGIYRNYEDSHPIDIRVRIISGLAANKKNEVMSRDEYLFKKCCIDTITSDTYSYDDDSVVKLQASFMATTIERFPGQGSAPPTPVELSRVVENDERYYANVWQARSEGYTNMNMSQVAQTVSTGNSPINEQTGKH